MFRSNFSYSLNVHDEGRAPLLRASLSIVGLYGFDVLQRFAFAVFPRDETICVATMYDCSRSTWTRKLSVSCEHQVIFLFSKHTLFL